jgi:3-phosphoshikimate 1-carboxyvinyltransferase
MVDCLEALGVDLRPDWQGTTIDVVGCDGTPPAREAALDARLSGTTSRFVLPVAALGAGCYHLDGGPPLRTRPLGPAIEALRSLGVRVGEPGAARSICRGTRRASS